jgi:hypothetical protein
MQMMTTSGEDESAPSSEDAIEAWREWFAVARGERQQPDEPYTGRHRPARSDHADGHSDSI